jgi:hypothetical protein
MALAEIWTFSMSVIQDDSGSSRSSKGRPSLNVNAIAGLEVDQNYFKVDPNQFRAN